jgi:CDP-diacylglycerol---glycerol-3-phosphate 3-phosphatidyltransferase
MNLPNFLSVVRIILSPVFLFLFSAQDFKLKTWGFIIFFIAVLTDWYDGWHARKYKSITNFGIFIDPLADKVLTSFAFYFFYVLGIMPLWMLIIIVIRDILVTLLRSYDEYRGITLKTSYIAKIKTFLQMTYIFLVLLLLLSVSGNFIPGYNSVIHSFLYDSVLNYSLLILITFLTFYTGVDYLVRKQYTKY